MYNIISRQKERKAYEELYRMVVAMDEAGYSVDSIAKETGLLKFQVLNVIQTEYGRRKIGYYR